MKPVFKIRSPPIHHWEIKSNALGIIQSVNKICIYRVIIITFDTSSAYNNTNLYPAFAVSISTLTFGFIALFADEFSSIRSQSKEGAPLKN